MLPFRTESRTLPSVTFREVLDASVRARAGGAGDLWQMYHHPDERPLLAALAAGAALSSISPHAALASTLAYHRGMGLADEGELWNPILDLLAETGGWPSEMLLRDTTRRSAGSIDERPHLTAPDQAALLSPWIRAQADSGAIESLLAFRARALRLEVCRSIEAHASSELVVPLLEAEGAGYCLAEHPQIVAAHRGLLSRWLLSCPAVAPLVTKATGMAPPFGELSDSDVRRAVLQVVVPDIGNGAPASATQRVGMMVLDLYQDLDVDDLLRIYALVRKAPSGAARVGSHPAAGVSVWRALAKDVTAGGALWVIGDSRVRREPDVRDILRASTSPVVLQGLLEDPLDADELHAVFRRLARVAPQVAVSLLEENEIMNPSDLKTADLLPLFSSHRTEVRENALRGLHRLKGQAPEE